MSTITEAIVVGVTHASNTNECNDETTSPAKNNSNNNTVEAWSVGSFIAKQRQNKRQKKGDDKWLIGIIRVIINYLITLYESLHFILFFSSISCVHRSMSSFSITKLASIIRPIISSTEKSTVHLSPEELQLVCRLGLDSHADISCARKQVRIIATYHGQMCNVAPFNDFYKYMRNIRTVDTVYVVDTSEGRTYILNETNR